MLRGRPIRLLKFPLVSETGNTVAATEDTMALVLVLPQLPVIPSTR